MENTVFRVRPPCVADPAQPLSNRVPGRSHPAAPSCCCFVFFSYLRIHLFLFIFGCAGSSLPRGLSLVATSRGYSLAVVRGLLIAVASLTEEHGL